MKENCNRLELLPMLPYNVLKKLIEDTSEKGELIWKLLKYSDSTAYKKSNLTKKEKQDMIYNGKGDINNFNVFLSPFENETTVEKKVYLRIYAGNNYPEDYKKSIQEVVFEVYCHPSLCILDNYQNRVDAIIQCIFDLLNGADAGQLGNLFYNITTKARCQIQIIGTKPYMGKWFVFGTRV